MLAFVNIRLNVSIMLVVRYCIGELPLVVCACVLLRRREKKHFERPENNKLFIGESASSSPSQASRA
jgi:hypothetical protein